ncbi:MAG: T9SS type A sorting domain-containing protein [Bacteroidetes bacterium]|nr:T9SS type A sorting domain-containing protein [Bacteroidota bacterium]
MKKFLIVLFFTFLSSHSVFCQWFEIYSENMDQGCYYPDPQTFSFLDTSSVMISNSREDCSSTTTAYYYINRTRNSFQSMQHIAGCGDHGYLYNFKMASLDTMFVQDNCYPYLGSKKTVNGGLTWQSIPYSIPSRFGFVNGNLGFGFLGDSLLRYSDDSLTFLRTISGYDLSSAYLCFFDSLKWLVMIPVNSGTNEIAVILRTTNAGLTFHPIVIDSAEQFILPANFHNENIAFIKTSSGYPYKTTDAGLTWVRLPIDSTKRGLDFVTENHAYKTGGDGSTYIIYYSSFDSGVTWDSLIIPHNMHGGGHFRMINDSVGFMLIVDNQALTFEVWKTYNNGGLAIGINTIQSKNTFKIFPNPTKGILNFQLPLSFNNTKNVRIRLYDCLGKCLNEEIVEYSTTINTFDLSEYSSGVYTISLSDDKQHFTGKIVVQ